MGVDPFSLAMIGFGALSAGMSVMGGVKAKERSEKQAEAVKLENEIKTKSKARQIQRQAGSQRSAFLASGITLTGEGTAQAVLGETYQFGLEDIDLMNRNSKTQQENLLSKGRSEFIAGLGKGALGFATTLMPFANFGGIAKAGAGASPSGGIGNILDISDITGGVG